MKNPTASAGFEPANLGTKGQHATSRPPKPLHVISLYTYLNTTRGAYNVKQKHYIFLTHTHTY